METIAILSPPINGKSKKVYSPVAPGSIEESGVNRSFLIDLILKHLYRFGELNGFDIADKICFPYGLIDELLDNIVFKQLAEKRGGRGLGNATDRFGLTERGRSYVRDIMDIDTYTGPVPVPLDQYTGFVKRDSVRKISVNHALLRKAWSGFILDEDMFRLIGPAMCSGKSCFFYGPPGTGKTTIAKMISQFYDTHGGHVAIPHAVLAGGSIIRVFDPVYHKKLEPTSSDDQNQWLQADQGDRRWVMCNRPTVVVGGELTLDMLDLRYNHTTRFYEAPLQMKANGGVFVIDDFGRQLVSPKDLLNRWIIPLEEHIDFLTLHTGKKFSVPFEQLVAFATNLDPTDLADEAFLRRIRYKIYVGELPVETYLKIFSSECEKKELQYDHQDLQDFIQYHYLQQKHPMRACDPRDLTDCITDHVRFHELPAYITPELFRLFSDRISNLSQKSQMEAQS